VKLIKNNSIDVNVWCLFVIFSSKRIFEYVQYIQDETGYECFKSESEIKTAAVELKYDFKGEMALHLIHVNGDHMRLACSRDVTWPGQMKVTWSGRIKFSGEFSNTDDWWSLRRETLELSRKL